MKLSDYLGISSSAAREPDGRVALHVQVYVKSREIGCHGAPGRLKLLVAPLAGGRTVTATAVGLPGSWKHSILRARLLLPPGRYQMRLTDPETPPLRLDILQVGGVLLREYCPHDVSSPTWSDNLGACPRGVAAASHVTHHWQSCCRSHLKRVFAQQPNTGDLTIYQALVHPLRARIGGRPALLKPGEFMVANRTDVFLFVPRAPFPLAYKEVCIYSRALAESLRKAGLPGPEGLRFDTAPRRTPASLAAAFIFLEAILKSPAGIAADVRIETALLQLVTTLLAEVPNTFSRAWQKHFRTARKTALGLDPRLAKAMRHIETHYAEPYDRDFLARHAGASRQLLQRLFQDQLKSTPVTYLQKIRIRKARELMADSALSIRGVAQAVGYADVRNFRRLFKRLEAAQDSQSRP